MPVHNILEEIVIKKVNNLYDKVKTMNTSWLTCDCKECRIDTVTYVLNRIPPRYIVSGRGITHQSAFENQQTFADIETLAMEGIKTIATSKRPYHGASLNSPAKPIKGPVFNFPSFLGTLSDGITFKPVEGVQVRLLSNGKTVEMIDYTWQNPLTTSLVTKGRYSFWVQPQEAKRVDEQKTFNFIIEASAPQYETTHYSFSVPVVSSESPNFTYNSTYSLQLQNLCLFSPEKQ